MKTPTIYQVKYATSVRSPYFFDRKTLQFFSQTMRDFRVRRSPTNRMFIYAPMRIDGNFAGYTFREVTDGTLENVRHDDGTMGNWNLFDVVAHINSH